MVQLNRNKQRRPRIQIKCRGPKCLAKIFQVRHRRMSLIRLLMGRSRLVGRWGRRRGIKDRQQQIDLDDLDRLPRQI